MAHANAKDIRPASDFLPWEVTEIAVQPYGPDFWSMNPSIHRDVDGTWRCVVRVVDYAMPDGVTIRSPRASPVASQTRNAMLILDPTDWRVAQVHAMRELDGLPRVACANVGFEDMRIFRTDRGGLQGIAASLHLDRGRSPTGSVRNQPPEQVLLSFDATYNVVAARPIRGAAWSGTPQKNWVPFDRCAEPRFLYSIDRGTIFGVEGAIREAAPAAPAAPPPVAASPPPYVDHRVSLGGASTQARGTQPVGRRASIDAQTSRPYGPSVVPTVAPRAISMMSGDIVNIGTGRTPVSRYPGLRGGTQLTRVGDDAWLGIGHEMRFVDGHKFYWHTWYVVDDRGVLKATSAPMKLASNGIEFAAGMTIDGNRVVVSFGVDDMACRIGETSLSAVLEILRVPAA